VWSNTDASTSGSRRCAAASHLSAGPTAPTLQAWPALPNRIARQQHLGDALDELATGGHLTWRWEYDTVRRRAIFCIAMPDATENAYDTRAAEVLVQRLNDQRGLRWFPVPAPGGEAQLAETLARMGGPN
jgi:hypothetical protein